MISAALALLPAISGQAQPRIITGAFTGAVLEALCPEWPQYTAASSILETSLSGTNPVTHGPIALFNLARMDADDDRQMRYADEDELADAGYGEVDDEEVDASFDSADEEDEY